MGLGSHLDFQKQRVSKEAAKAEEYRLIEAGKVLRLILVIRNEALLYFY